MNLWLILSAENVDYVISIIIDDVGCFFFRIRLIVGHKWIKIDLLKIKKKEPA